MVEILGMWEISGLCASCRPMAVSEILHTIDEINTVQELKNWSGRNEIIATSGRLHPSRPQNKWLYTPWTKDNRHTRQDRWIQTELAFTLAKNATIPEPVEIISLQTTRKENNWKTEGALARTVVTLETERIELVRSLMYMMMMMNTVHTTICVLQRCLFL